MRVVRDVLDVGCIWRPHKTFLTLFPMMRTSTYCIDSTVYCNTSVLWTDTAPKRLLMNVLQMFLVSIRISPALHSFSTFLTRT